MTPRRRKAAGPTRRGTARPEGVRRPSAVESGVAARPRRRGDQRALVEVGPTVNDVGSGRLSR
jgi:hypothetical protein